MLIFDLSHVAVASVMVQAAPKHGVAPGSDMLRHIILDSIRQNIVQFKSYAKPVVIAIDGRGSWRKEAFKYYKFNRNEDKKKNAPNVDWKAFYELMTELQDDLGKHFPFVVICHDKAEGDDVVGTIVRHHYETDPFDGILIIGGDKDYKQLHFDPRVRQWSPVLKKYVTSDGAEFERKHIILNGDRLDGVPNVLSPDDSFARKIRQNKLTAKKKAELLTYDHPDDIRDEVIRRNYYRNMVLTDLTKVPKTIQEDIREQFETKRNKLAPSMKVFNYLVSKQLTDLSRKAGDFI